MRRPDGGARRPAVLTWAPRSMIWRLWRGLVVFALLFAGGGLIIFFGVNRQSRALDTVVRRIQPLQAANLSARADFANAQAVLRAYILSGDGRFLVFYRSQRAGLSSSLAQAARLAAGAERAEVAAQRRAEQAWFGYGDRMETLAAGDPRLARLTVASYPSASAFYQANNRLHALVRAEDRRAIAQGLQALNSAIIWSTILATTSFLLGLAVVGGLIRGVTRPLSGITATLRRLTSGDHGARAEVLGSAETREVSRSLNALADESDRLRRQEAESDRLRRMARAVGFRIREHLRAEDVVGEARRALEENIDADAVYLHVIREGQLGPPEGHGHDWVLPATFLPSLTPASFQYLGGLLRAQTSTVVNDMAGPEADQQLPPEVRGPLREAGVVSHLLTPFGVGTELLGIIAAERMRVGHPWTRPEVDAVESIAADLGRGLHHARLYEDENRLVTELKAVDRAKSDFLAAVSHELRTPLTSISGYVELLLEADVGPLNRGQERMLTVVDRNTTRLRRLIEDLLTLSRIESGAFKTVMQPVDLVEVAGAATAALQPEARAKELDLVPVIPDRAVMVSGDPGQLDRMAMNLLANAVKFTPRGGRVDVGVSVEGAMAVLRVGDTGIGIPADELKQLFTRFFRASNAVDASIPGSGLGLTIVRTIVENHGGEVSFASEPGAGTVVTVRIPLLTSGWRGPGAGPDSPARRPVTGGAPSARGERPA